MSSNEKNGGAAAKKSFFQLIKFGLVGIGNTLIDMVISTVLSIVLAIPFTGGWTVYVSKVVGYCAGILNSYILNSRWTFKEERRQDAREIISFIAVNLGVLLVSLGLIWLFTNALHIDDWWMSLGLPQWLTKIKSVHAAFNLHLHNRKLRRQQAFCVQTCRGSFREKRRKREKSQSEH